MLIIKCSTGLMATWGSCSDRRYCVCLLILYAMAAFQQKWIIWMIGMTGCWLFLHVYIDTVFIAFCPVFLVSNCSMASLPVSSSPVMEITWPVQCSSTGTVTQYRRPACLKSVVSSTRFNCAYYLLISHLTCMKEKTGAMCQVETTRAWKCHCHRQPSCGALACRHCLLQGNRDMLSAVSITQCVPVKINQPQGPYKPISGAINAQYNISHKSFTFRRVMLMICRPQSVFLEETIILLQETAHQYTIPWRSSINSHSKVGNVYGLVFML